MKNYRPEDARWDNLVARDNFDDSRDGGEDLLFFEEDERARRFELISAYLDGEVTPEERHEVQHWLDTDPDAKKLYHQLRGLGTHLQQIPIPVSIPADRLAEGVFRKVDRRRNRRAFLYGGAVLAAMAFALVSHGLFGRDAQMARNSIEAPRESDSLMIALNHPLVEMPDNEETGQKQ